MKTSTPYDPEAYPTTIRTVTADQELWIQIKGDSLGWDSLVGVLHVIWILSINPVDAGDGYVLLPIG